MEKLMPVGRSLVLLTTMLSLAMPAPAAAGQAAPANSRPAPPPTAPVPLAPAVSLATPAPAAAGQAAPANSSPAPSPTAQAPTPQGLEAYVREQMRRTGIASVSLAIVDDGRIVRVESYGVANRENGTNARPETLFQA